MGSFSRWVKLPFSPASVLTGSFHAATGPTSDRTQTSQKNTLRSVWQESGLVRSPISCFAFASRPSCPVVDLKLKSQFIFEIVHAKVSLTDLPFPIFLSLLFRSFRRTLVSRRSVSLALSDTTATITTFYSSLWFLSLFFLSICSCNEW